MASINGDNSSPERREYSLAIDGGAGSRWHETNTAANRRALSFRVRGGYGEGSTAQVNALSALLRIAPADKRVTSALQSFVSRPLDLPTKEALANGIANSRTENTAATDQLIAFLDDGNEQERFQAAQGLQRMPNDMVVRAKPALFKAIERPDQSQEVRDAAEEALRNAGPGK